MRARRGELAVGLGEDRADRGSDRLRAAFRHPDEGGGKAQISNGQPRAGLFGQLNG
jgi:hypothetical protein